MFLEQENVENAENTYRLNPEEKISDNHQINQNSASNINTAIYEVIQNMINSIII